MTKWHIDDDDDIHPRFFRSNLPAAACAVRREHNRRNPRHAPPLRTKLVISSHVPNPRPPAAAGALPEDGSFKLGLEPAVDGGER